MKAIIFPGQGSQSKGMGAGLFDAYAELVEIADEILNYSLKELCLQDPNDHLNITQYTQPALYVVNSLSYLRYLDSGGAKPAFLAGHSLGEYNALFAAGAFDFGTGLKLVKKRAELMGAEQGGAMAAVVGLNRDRIERLIEENSLKTLGVANFNTPSQFVISGHKEDIEAARAVFQDAKAQLYLPLTVSGAFHSVHMRPARLAFEEYLREFTFSELQLPVIANVNAKPYSQHEIASNLSMQVTQPVLWTHTVTYLRRQNVTDFEEIGPGRVLTGLVRKITAEYRDTDLYREPAPQNRNTTLTSQDVVTAESLGSKEFRADYNIRYAYVAGAMYRGIASENLVIRMAKSGMIGYFGTGGLAIPQIDKAIRNIQAALSGNEPYGMNFLANPQNPKLEGEMVDLFLQHGIRNIEAAAFVQINPALVKYRLKGLGRNARGEITATNRIMAKVSRPEVARAFMSPAPRRIVLKLLERGEISHEQAQYSERVPMADDLCVEADSGGHTDGGNASTLMPAILKLRDRLMDEYRYKKQIRVGAAGGIGTPEAAAAAFILGADFILTGSINQCTVEAGTSSVVKNMLQQMNVQDTQYAPAGDMFEIGAKVQVLSKGLFYPARANKLYDLYKRYNALDEIDENTRRQIENSYFKKSFSEIYDETKTFFKDRPDEIDKAERNPKYKMALVFRWYLGRSTHFAINGIEEQKLNYQIHCGPALGAFNQWVQGTALEDWRSRHVDRIGEKLMVDTAALLNKRFSVFKAACISPLVVLGGDEKPQHQGN